MHEPSRISDRASTGPQRQPHLSQVIVLALALLDEIAKLRIEKLRRHIFLVMQVERPVDIVARGGKRQVSCVARITRLQ